jgi:hypothetical protein
VKSKSIIILTCIVIFSIIFRLQFLGNTTFPLHDGGFFFSLINDLINNNFQLPSIASYNHSSIPFAYPPFGFYLTAIISVLFKIDLLSVITYIPLIFNILSIIAFFFFVKEVINDDNIALLSTLFFSLLPMQFKWSILGGGITRSIAMFFCGLALIFVSKYFYKQKWQALFPSICFSSLTILSHPEFAWFLFYSIGILVLYRLKNNVKDYLQRSCILIVGILVIISPWLIWILRTIGTSFFLPFLDSGFSKTDTVINFILLKWTDEALLPFISLLGIIGIVVTSRRKYYFLTLWLFTIWMIQGRAEIQKIIFPLAILAGISLSAFVTFISNNSPIRLGKVITYLSISFCIAFSTINGYLSVYTLARPLSIDTIKAISWIDENTPVNATFYVFTDNGWVFDNYSEWIVALTGRESVSVVQGYEWLPGFSRRISQYDSFHSNFMAGKESFLEYQDKIGKDVDYIFIPKEKTDFDRIINITNDFTRIYENNSILILKE